MHVCAEYKFRQSPAQAFRVHNKTIRSCAVCEVRCAMCRCRSVITQRRCQISGLFLWGERLAEDATQPIPLHTYISVLCSVSVLVSETATLIAEILYAMSENLLAWDGDFWRLELLITITLSYLKIVKQNKNIYFFIKIFKIICYIILSIHLIFISNRQFLFYLYLRFINMKKISRKVIEESFTTNNITKPVFAC